MTTPPLGELAVRAGILDGARLGELLTQQQEQRRKGDFRRIGELMAEARIDPRTVRSLLTQQGITIVRCELCATRLNGIGFQGGRPCFRCGHRLVPTEPDEALSVEDAITDPGPQGDEWMRGYLARALSFSRYRILGEIGRGGMGVIYKAWEGETRRYVALKFLLQTGDYYESVRFKREAEAICQLAHPHIVRGFTYEEVSGLSFMAMDYVAGVALDVLTKRGVLSPHRLVHVAAQVASALHHAHEKGLIHRDVKPGNIVIDRRGEVWLVDFGIAKSAAESMSLTAEGETLGTLYYMAPEYLTQGVEALEPQADVYGLGVVLYEALAGRLPHGEPDDEMLMRVVQQNATPLAKACPGVPKPLAQAVDRAIARDPAARFPSAQAFGEALDAFLSDATQGPFAPQDEDPVGVFRRAGEAAAQGVVATPDLGAPEKGVLSALKRFLSS